MGVCACVCACVRARVCVRACVRVCVCVCVCVNVASALRRQQESLFCASNFSRSSFIRNLHATLKYSLMQSSLQFKHDFVTRKFPGFIKKTYYRKGMTS